mgnify:CR=1 FL=1
MLRTQQSGRKEQLIQRLTASRAALRSQRARFQNSLDLKAQVQASVKKSPAKWAVGSAVAGLVGSRFFRRKNTKVVDQHVNKQVVKSESKIHAFSRLLTSVLIGIIRPLLVNYLKQKTSLGKLGR